MPEPKRGYTTGEAARLAALLSRGSVKAVRGRDTGRIDARIERVQREACEREAAEDRAREEARRAKIEAKAKRRAGRWL